MGVSYIGLLGVIGVDDVVEDSRYRFVLLLLDESLDDAVKLPGLQLRLYLLEELLVLVVEPIEEVLYGSEGLLENGVVVLFHGP